MICKATYHTCYFMSRGSSLTRFQLIEPWFNIDQILHFSYRWQIRALASAWLWAQDLNKITDILLSVMVSTCFNGANWLLEIGCVMVGLRDLIKWLLTHLLHLATLSTKFRLLEWVFFYLIILDIVINCISAAYSFWKKRNLSLKN